MSTIGSGPNIGTGPQFDTSAARTAAQVNSATTQAANAAPAPAAPAAQAPSTAQVSSAQVSSAQSMVSSSTSAGSPPVDSDRTSAIKAAIKNGTYPILPTKISDAMIAASLILRTAA